MKFDVAKQELELQKLKSVRWWGRAQLFITMLVCAYASYRCFEFQHDPRIAYKELADIVSWMGLVVTGLTGYVWWLMEKRWSKLQELYERQIALMTEANRRGLESKQDS